MRENVDIEKFIINQARTINEGDSTEEKVLKLLERGFSDAEEITDKLYKGRDFMTGKAKRDLYWERVKKVVDKVIAENE